MSPPKMSASASVRSIVSPAASSAATSDVCSRSIASGHHLDAARLGNRQHPRHQRIVGRSADAQEAVAVDFVLEAAHRAGVRRLETVRLVGAHLPQIEHRRRLRDDGRDVGDGDVVRAQHRRERRAGADAGRHDGRFERQQDVALHWGERVRPGHARVGPRVARRRREAGSDDRAGRIARTVELLCIGLRSVPRRPVEPCKSRHRSTRMPLSAARPQRPDLRDQPLRPDL